MPGGPSWVALDEPAPLGHGARCQAQAWPKRSSRGACEGPMVSFGASAAAGRFADGALRPVVRVVRTSSRLSWPALVSIFLRGDLSPWSLLGASPISYFTHFNFHFEHPLHPATSEELRLQSQSMAVCTVPPLTNASACDTPERAP